MNKSDLLALVKIRVKEAQALLASGHYDGAYYLAGYAMECAIKACIAGKIKNNVVPDRNFVQNFYQHDLERLLKAAGLWTTFETDLKAKPALSLNWAVVKDWNESSRYEYGKSQAEATDLVNAIVTRKAGILGWVKRCM